MAYLVNEILIGHVCRAVATEAVVVIALPTHPMTRKLFWLQLVLTCLPGYLKSVFNAFSITGFEVHPDASFCSCPQHG